MKPRILIVDDEPSAHEGIAQILGRKMYDLRNCLNKATAEALLSNETFDLAIIDLNLSDKHGDESGFELLTALKSALPDMPVIVITQYYLQPDMVVKCMRNGAYHYFIKEHFADEPDKFVQLIDEAIRFRPAHDSIEETYPHPIALLHRDCQRNVVAHQFKFERLIQLLEVVLKFCGIICIADFVQSGQRDERVKDYLARFVLRTPSMGSWNELIQVFSASDARDDYFWIPKIANIFTPRIKKNIGDLIQTRNRTIGHGATKAEHEYALLTQECEPKINRLLHNAGLLGSTDLFLVKSTKKYSNSEYDHSVVNLKGHNPKFLTPEKRLSHDLLVNKVYVLEPKNDVVLCLHPFLILALCSQCGHETVFLYDKFDGDMIHFVDYVNGHHHRSLEFYRDMMPVLVSTRSDESHQH